VPDPVNVWYLSFPDVVIVPPVAVMKVVLLLPNPSDIEIAPEASSNKVRTASAPILIAAVAVKPSSTFTCCREIELPDDGNVMYYFPSNSLTLAESSFIASIK
jgi:hypothetical protein